MHFFRLCFLLLLLLMVLSLLLVVLLVPWYPCQPILLRIISVRFFFFFSVGIQIMDSLVPLLLLSYILFISERNPVCVHLNVFVCVCVLKDVCVLYSSCKGWIARKNDTNNASNVCGMHLFIHCSSMPTQEDAVGCLALATMSCHSTMPIG